MNKVEKFILNYGHWIALPFLAVALVGSIIKIVIAS